MPGVVNLYRRAGHIQERLSVPQKIAIFIFKLLFIVALFVLIFRPQTFGLREDLFKNVTPYTLWEVIQHVDPGRAVLWLGFAVLVKLIGIMAGVVRWRVLLRAQGVHIPFWYLTKCWFWGRAIGLFLPGTLGLDGYRLVESSRYTGEVVKCTTVVVVEKLSGFIALFTLVFFTVPLGLRLFNINLALLGAVLTVLMVFIAGSLLMLLNPRVIQVLVSVVPLPGKLQNLVNKFGAAALAYSTRRGALFAALALGLTVHLGICFMYFGTAMAVRAAGVSVLDVLFAAPLIIVGSVLAPTVSGVGVREFIMTGVLKAKAGAEHAFLAGHLGLWVGEIIPLIISLPLLLFTGRPNREELMEEADEVRAAARDIDTHIEIPPEEARRYRKRLVNGLAAGVFGGLIGGAVVGLAEAGWINATLEGLTELGAFWWGPPVYAALFLPVGVGAACALLFLYLLFDRFPRPQITFALSLGGVLGAGALIIGMFRYGRDILAGHVMTSSDYLTVGGFALTCALVAAAIGAAATVWARGGLVKGIAAGIAALLILFAGGAAASKVLAPAPRTIAFTPGDANGPNVIFMVADALRADYLPLFSSDAVAKTPNLQALADDGIMFQGHFSQASWTKPAFATLFSGLYPEAHTATSKTAALPDEVTTFPELLSDAGYFTKGFANNPNITAIFNFDQGFTDYVDLKPDLLFGATSSASKLSMYEVLRKVRNKVRAKIPGAPMRVTDFYQPADEITSAGFGWLDGSERPSDAPFFLFLHYMDSHDPFMDWANPGVGYARNLLGDPDPERYREPMISAYNQEIEYMDHEMGRFIEGLKARGLYDDSLIVFTADHGEEFYDHDGWWHGQTLYDEVLYVPLIIKLPGNANAGQASQDLARHIDVGPTILSFAGVSQADAMSGKPLLSRDGTPANQTTTFAYAENDFEGNVLQAARTKDAKLITANEENKRDLAPVAFYDLHADPYEQQNLAGEGDPREETLRGILDQMQEFIHENAAEPTLVEESTEELQEQMENLGYL